MTIYKIIELVGRSPTSWEDAVQSAVAEASKTIRNIVRVSCEEFDVKIENDKVVTYRVRVKLIFEIER
ncbi:MAG: dodecin family protein [Promethearchaeota archaeon]